MSFYTHMIESIPLRTELATSEIIELTTGKGKDDYKPWEWTNIKNRTLTALNKGVVRQDIIKVGYRAVPGETKRVMIWMRV